MLIKNKLVIAFVMSVLFISSCSNEMAVESSADSGSSKAYAEFMACTAGPDFNAENAMKMIGDWQKLITADSLLGAWGYVPDGDTNAFGDTLW
jgi:PBP1b-binding outer membrane lipoprotein LpoB